MFYKVKYQGLRLIKAKVMAAKGHFLIHFFLFLAMVQQLFLDKRSIRGKLTECKIINSQQPVQKSYLIHFLFGSGPMVTG